MSLRESVKLDALSGMRRELERLGIDPRDWFSREKGQRVWLVELLPFQGAVPFQGAEPRKFYDGDTFFSGDRRTAIWNENGKRFRSRRSALGALNREVGRGVPRARLVLVESVEFELRKMSGVELKGESDGVTGHNTPAAIDDRPVGWERWREP